MGLQLSPPPPLPPPPTSPLSSSSPSSSLHLLMYSTMPSLPSSRPPLPVIRRVANCPEWWRVGGRLCRGGPWQACRDWPACLLGGSWRDASFWYIPIASSYLLVFRFGSISSACPVWFGRPGRLAVVAVTAGCWEALPLLPVWRVGVGAETQFPRAERAAAPVPLAVSVSPRLQAW